jgi:hypothetical protein
MDGTAPVMVYSDSGIDLNRGVLMKKDSLTGMYIYTYIGDKEGNGAEPGVYYNARGVQVPLKMAAQAGFDTIEDQKKKLFMERMVKFAAEQKEALAFAATPNNGKVVKEKDGYKAIDVGVGFDLIDPEGVRLNTNHLDKKQVLRMLEIFTTPDEAVEDDAPAKPGVKPLA